MVPPKYNFYVGKLNTDVVLYQGNTIDDNGKFVGNSNAYASNTMYVNDTEAVFVNFKSLQGYNTIFFYDSNKTLLSKVSLLNKSIISVPEKAYYFALRFATYDTNFINKKDTQFIYAVEKIEPHFKDLSKKYSKESGQEFFRVSLDGKINLFGSAYEVVKQSSLEDQLIFIIDRYKRATNIWVEYYKGEFNKTDCKFDYDKKKCELKTTAIDAYNEVMNKYDNTYDLIKLAPEITRIDLHKRSLMQVYVRGANSITNFFGGTYWEDDINEVVDNHDALINKYYFSYIKAGNEFYVENAGIAAVNGVYAGTNGSWDQWNGYTCYMGTNTPGVYAYIYIKRNSDNTILYRSVKQRMFTEANNCYIGREDIEMVNVNDASDKFTIESPFVYHIYRRLLCDVDTVKDSEGVKNTYDLPSDDFATNSRNYKKCIGLKGGLFFCTSRAVDEPTKYGLNDYGQYFTNSFIPSSLGLGRALPISKNSWANASLWYVYDSSYEFFEERLRKQYTLKDSYSIGAVIKAVLKKIDPTISHEPTAEYSKFLYDTTNPLGFARFYVYITQKTNILKGNYDQPAQKAETSLEVLMKMLRDCFRCYWYIEDNKFKIEHIYFFMNGGSYQYQSNYQLDFTKLTDQFNKKLSSYFQSEIEFDKSDLNHRYEFAWMDNVTDLFGGVTIDVNSNYIQKDKTEEISIGQFSSDVDFMLFNPNNFSDDGFALLCPTKPSFYIYNTINDKYLNVAGSINISTNVYNIEVYKVEQGKTYRVKGSSIGKIATFAIYKDPGLSELVRAYLPHLGSFRYEVDTRVTIPEEGQYLAITRYKDYSDEEKVKITESYGLELPIITIDGLIDENGDTYKAVAQNWYASWLYLIQFYSFDMPAINAKSNAIQFYTRNIKRCMKHTIEFPSEEDLDELELIKTTFGNGKIGEMSFNINTRQAKVNLLYLPQ